MILEYITFISSIVNTLLLVYLVTRPLPLRERLQNVIETVREHAKSEQPAQVISPAQKRASDLSDLS